MQYTPPNLPQVSMPDPRIYAAMGDTGIIELVRAVYRELGRSRIAGMFPKGEAALQAAADKSALFWITACGGPAYYEQQFGHPRMRARHLNFAIDEPARRDWLACWEIILPDSPTRFGMPADCLESFRAYLYGFSAWMVNIGP